ncbi:MAG: LysR family transcriptional regulator [Rubrivivax sp.]
MDIERARRRVRLRDLETLAAVVQAGGMRKAATQLHLSQPAVSKAMAELEDAVGLKLMERGRQGIQPTPFGAALASRSEALIDGVRGALRELQELADPGAGEVRLGSMETLHAGVVGATAVALLDRHPRLRLVFESGQSPDLIEHFLLRRVVDFVVARPYSPVLPAAVAAEPLLHDRLLVVAGPQHMLARRRKVDWPELCEQNWILSRNEAQPDSPVTLALAARGLALPPRVMLSGSLMIRLNLLATGRFLTCIPHSLVPFLPNRGELRVLPVRLPLWRTATMIMTLRGRVQTPAAELFLAELRLRARPLVDSGPD